METPKLATPTPASVARAVNLRNRYKVQCADANAESARRAACAKRGYRGPLTRRDLIPPRDAQ